ncbi:urease subunit alpha, partial [Nocardioides sp. NPDC000441]
LADRLGLRRRLVGISPTREIGKADMVNNSATPEIRVEPETFRIHVDGELIEPAPATELPLTQLYSMF